ncbi:MAG TPA: DUF4844 domain-containing protein [Rhizomicrobium sp.]|nr:DUF4844 domain-containing protein [Rhizomicrobium sp.]
MGLAMCLALVFSAVVLSGMLLEMPDQQLIVTPDIVARLEALKPRLRFEPDGYYTGIHDPLEREQANASFADLVGVLEKELPEHPSRKFVLQQFSSHLRKFPSVDTEDRERAATHCEKIMDVLGIRSSDGVLNRWLYGPILGRLVRRKP